MVSDGAILVPCAYCGATFGTEESLIAHMESRHPGKPYLVSAYLPQSYVLQSRSSSHNAAPFDARGYVPDSRYYQFHSWIGSDAYADAVSIRDQPAGFYEVGASIRTFGVTGPPPHYIYLPLGTYAIRTSCVLIEWVPDPTMPGTGQWELRWLWQGLDIGLTIDVVEAPPPAPDLFISGVQIQPAEVRVGQPVEILIIVANRGEITGSMAVTCTVNGEIIDARTVTRTPGQYEGYYLYFTPQQSGTYQVEVDGIMGSFTVLPTLSSFAITDYGVRE